MWFMSRYFQVSKDKPKRVRGAIIEAIRNLKPGESVLLPASSGCLISTVGNLRAKGEARAGEYTVQTQGQKAARIWRLKV